ncbi:MAG: NAD(+) synthase [Kiritimatiellae bacterium]|nr:NAD(+) synthase [Kiritimatiellia bacterium]
MKGFLRLAAAVPQTRPGDIAANTASIIATMRIAAGTGASLAVFPELCVTGATCGDLFFRGETASAALKALEEIAKASAAYPSTAFVVGLPMRRNGLLCDCAAVVAGGSVKGVVEKRIAPGDSASRHFSHPAEPFADMVFADDSGELEFSVSFSGCEIPCCAASVVAKLCATPAVADEHLPGIMEDIIDSRRRAAIVVSANAGWGESSSDRVYDGFARIVENGDVIAAAGRFERTPSVAVADADPDAIAYARARGWTCDAPAHAVRIPLGFAAKSAKGRLKRAVDPHPFVPQDPKMLSMRCAEAFSIQTSALATRMEAIGCRNVVVGLSGGLDSALALLVCVEAFAMAKLPKKGIEVLTMPGFGTTRRTKGNAELLAEGLGLGIETVDITESVRAHFRDIGQDESVRDVTYENAQARMRTLVLMDRANQSGGIVVGTGDLSEVALGWCTYNGDHMSMYGVNAGIPKTLVREIVRWYANERAGSHSPAGKALLDILATPVSPELLPAKADGTIAQETEDRVGPYELHDFFLYNFIERGASKRKIADLAAEAFRGKYSKAEVGKWLDVFFRRFMTQQFKRNCSPEGPSALRVSLAPRTGWQMPGDAKFPS